MIGAWILAQLGRFWLPLTLLGLIASGWVAFGVQTHRLETAVQEREQFAERERQARVAAFDDVLRQRAIARQVESDAKRDLQAADARSADLARRLRGYLARPVPGPGAAPAAPDDTARIAGFTAAIGSALADVVQGCSRDAVRFTALQAWAERVTASDAK